MDRDVVVKNDFPSNKSTKGEYDTLFLDEHDIMHWVTSPNIKNLSVVINYDNVYGGSHGGALGLGKLNLFG